MMYPPTKEQLEYGHKVRPWIINGKEVEKGKWVLELKEDTPQEILDLFNEIKDNLKFCY